jgi:hypothetical protein
MKAHVRILSLLAIPLFSLFSNLVFLMGQFDSKSARRSRPRAMTDIEPPARNAAELKKPATLFVQNMPTKIVAWVPDTLADHTPARVREYAIRVFVVLEQRPDEPTDKSHV